MGLLNVALLLLAPAPAIIWDQTCRRSQGATHATHLPRPFSLLMVPSCRGWQEHPVAGVNSLLLWNMCLGFWGLSLLQNSTWVSTILVITGRPRPLHIPRHSGSCSLQLIDPYWTLIPSLIEAYYATHPAATGSSRSKCTAAMVAAWSLRLSHSYLRR